MSAGYDQAALEALAAFLPVFEAPGFKFSQNDSPFRQTGENSFEMVGYHYHPAVGEFLAAIDKHGWLYRFDWVAWKATPEFSRLRVLPDEVSHASAIQLSKLLSLYVAWNRMSEGELLSLWDTGLLLRILRRAATLAEQEQSHEAS